MLKVKLFAFIVLGVISTSCKDDENALKNLFSIENSTIKPILKLEESIDLVLQNKENKTKIRTQSKTHEDKQKGD